MSNDTIKLTEAAKAHVRQYLSRSGATAMRLGLKKTGCSGWSYEVSSEAEVREEDRVFEDDGITVVVDDAIWGMVKGTTIDYVRQGLNTLFTFQNPQVTDECGCGESFVIEPASAA